jgi:hypothetical protein
MNSLPEAPCGASARKRQAVPMVSRPARSPHGAARMVPAQRRFPAMTHSLWPSGPLAAVAVAMSGRIEGQRLYEITIPGLAIGSEFADLRRSVLAAFPRVVEVFAMHTPETVLVAYRGEDEIDAWCETLSRAVARRRRTLLEGELSPVRPKALPRRVRPALAVAARRSP